MGHVTYDRLFAYLLGLGFADLSPSEFERVFEHREFDLLLAFSMLNDPSGDRIARDADVLSAEFQLQQHGLLEGSLVEVANERVREV